MSDRIMSASAALAEALHEEMARDETVFILGEDLTAHAGIFGQFKGIPEKFPGRILDTPISEACIAGCGVGSALTGMRPIVDFHFADFVTCGMDEFCNQAAKIRYMFGAKMSLPVTIRMTMGGRRAAAAQHSQCLESWFMHVPGLKIAMPSNAHDAKGLLKTAVRDPNPVLFLENKVLYNECGEVPADPYFVPFGQANVVRQGTDVTVVALSDMVGFALKAADTLAREGVSVEVIDPRTLVPLDIEGICASVKKTNRLVIAHEACLTGGAGAEIAAQVQHEVFSYLDAPIERVGAKDSPIPFAPALEHYILPNDKDVVEAARRTLYRAEQP